MNAVFSAFINGAIAGAVLTAAIWLALRLMPRRSINAATRYGVWWIALAAAVVMPVFYMPAGQSGSAPVLGPRPSVLSLAPAVRSPERAPASVKAVTSPAPAPSTAAIFPVAITLGQWPGRIAALWAAASLLMLIRLAGSYRALHLRKARALSAPSDLSVEFESWLQRAGRHSVQIGITHEISTPMAAGPFRPAILIPQALLSSLDDEELRQIGLHEAAHLVRRDDYALLAQRTVEALFALHPVARWIARQIDLEREIACDDLVIEATGQPRRYAACLTHVVELAGSACASPAAANAAEDRSHLSRRIDMLLNKNRGGQTKLTKLLLTIAAGSVSAAVWLASQTPGAIVLAQARPTPRPAVTQIAQPAPVPVPVPTPGPVASEPAAVASEPAPAASEQAPASQPEQQVQGPQSNPRIIVPLTVTDPLGRLVTGLERDQFKVFDDGVEQRIDNWITGDDPISIAVVMETNDRSAALYNQLTGSTDDVSFVNPRPGSAPGQAPSAAALLDAVQVASSALQHSPLSRRIILIFAGGSGPLGSYSDVDVEAASQTGGAPIYVLGPPAAGGDTSRQAFLESLAHKTGGRVTWEGAATPNASVALARMKAGWHNFYLIKFTPSNWAVDGKFHKLKVEFNAPRGLPPLNVRYRSGYYAPVR